MFQRAAWALALVAGCSADDRAGSLSGVQAIEAETTLPGEFIGAVTGTQQPDGSVVRMLEATEPASGRRAPAHQYRYSPGPLPSRGPRSSGAGVAATDDSSSFGAALQAAAALPSDADVQITIALEEPAFDFARLANPSDAMRQQAIDERRALLEQAQSESVARLQGIGAREIEHFWLANLVKATVKAGDVAAIRSWPGVRGISTNGRLEEEAYDGALVRSGTLTENFLRNGFKGEHPTNGRLRIGQIERRSRDPNNYLARSHVSFVDRPGGASRVREVYDCNTCTGWFIGCISWGCVPTTAPPGSATHGTAVASIMLGSIEEGQDSAFQGSGTLDQRRRSGIATGADLFYYAATDCDAVSRALQRAVQDGVSVVNMSLGLGDQPNTGCDRGFNCGGLNEAIRSATNAGVVIVKSAGNDGNGSFMDGCSLTYPAQRPEVLTVGGLDTLRESTSYTSLNLYGPTSSGPIPVQYSGYNGTDTIAGVALVAPAVRQFEATDAPRSYNLTYLTEGTSFATAVVSGATVLLRDFFNRGFAPNTEARAVLTNMLLMGDTWDRFVGKRRTGVSQRSGFGRLRMHYPSNLDLMAPWGWGWRAFNAGVGTHTWTVWDAGPESPSTRQWKWATAYFPDDLNNIRFDYIIEAWDACPPGGTPELVARDDSFDLRKRIHLQQNEICVPGRPQCRCLEMRLQVLMAPSGGGAFYSADYFHGGDPALH
jgi:hypothetical protein